MSWNPFSRSSSAQKKPVISRNEQKEFDNVVKKLDELEELTRRLYKDMKRLKESNNALSKVERKLSQDLMSTQLCQSDEHFKRLIDEWDSALLRMDMHMTEKNVLLQRTVLEPLKKYVSIFPYAQVAIKKREQSLQEFQKCQDKFVKQQETTRTGQNVVKLDMQGTKPNQGSISKKFFSQPCSIEQSKKALAAAQADFSSQNTALMQDIPKMIENRTDYFQPSLEADIKAQVQYTTEAVKVYGELSYLMNGHNEQSKHDYVSQIHRALADLKALSITAD
ncbi:bridging integrator 3-like isoform X1 [Physella acuta]|uniref:bridging integrator 3-like isoform X1 n=1 Tax=Physella acuta TaxID=109671 RepID=UPI0027DE4911|nr:bridging integrator 3-like isoform X1 [Physella acuta]XP_059144886.1 bridging integrator 3-like isoform X1 [Physella acuta]